MKARKARKITHRVSSVTNGFVQAILPDTVPDATQQAQVLAILGIDRARPTCVYCGDPAQHWDHLNSFVKAKRPSGYLNEARNVVPACGPCNTSKSGHNWRLWLRGDAKGSPKSRGILDLDEREALLIKLETEMGLQPIDFVSLVDPDLWRSYWQRRDEIERLLFDAQGEAEQLRKQIVQGLEQSGG